MNFNEMELKGAYLIELEEFCDERGTFARQFCKKEFEKQGIEFEVCQANISKNYKKGTLRGLHFQKAPYFEAKIISCFKGAFFDVIVDLREDSPTYLKHSSVELTENSNQMLYIPPMFAHGFQTLTDDTVIYYQLGNYFAPQYYDGIRRDDPKLGIKWPDCKQRIINERDNSYELL
ncbi:MAG: dTDP-4-dehydrorhamnose 3,5-epimerase [bacterium]